MTPASALLEDGAWILAESRRAAERAAELREETRELMLTYRLHRIRAIASGTDGRDGRADGATVAVLRHLLQTAPADPLCDACLAFALDVSLEHAQSLTVELAKQSLVFPRAVRACAACRRHIITISYDPLGDRGVRRQTAG